MKTRSRRTLADCYAPDVHFNPEPVGRQANEMLEGMRTRPRGKIVLGVDL